MKNIIILGSSGGNLYSLGGKNPDGLLKELLVQMEAAEFHCAGIQFIAAQTSMDHIKESTPASLYIWSEEEQRPLIASKGTLEEINQAAIAQDERLAAMIANGEVDGVILMSASPGGANRLAIEAAATAQLPVTGTGGTSMAAAATKGLKVISTSGTTGTTNRTRAVSFITSLSKHWGKSYRPVIGKVSSGQGMPQGTGFSRINIRGIMLASLPGFIAMALILAASQIPGLTALSQVFDIMIAALPVIIAVVAAKQVAELDEVSIVAGIVAGVLSVNGGIIGGLIGGIGAGLLANYLFRKCVEWRFPATTVNIVAGGVAGLVAGLVVYFFIAPIAAQAGEGIRTLLENLVQANSALAGLIAGLLIWPAILGGVYHAAILPIVLLEMERSGNSFLGAVDMTGLVMVSAGITLANIIAPQDKGAAAVAAPGFLINIGFGTFVEAAYPFMFASKWVFGGAIFSAGLGGLLVGVLDVRGIAYVPAFAAPFSSNHIAGFAIAMLGSLTCSFVITLIINLMFKNRKKKEAIL
ncbi:PTS sugar transporter [Paenibacillus sp. CFBP13512]|uniref:PTS sugar transporter n=1 Tax=Paenibacillus sp. CFBP13512 TaxID=2184007 RepID=UPI0010C13CFC|nr:PTS sugar transporter [Paenibacillus sp. CFBP13512]TKJ90591.1 PTS sugar transporter [Paenibacillus sp. CFBP13512]